MKYLTVQEAMAGYRYIMQKTNSSMEAGIRDKNLLESALARPQQSAFGRDADPYVFDKAAALLHSLIKNHPFLDGNKRTAYVLTKVFLKLNGYHFSMPKIATVEFVVAIVNDAYSLSDISGILKRNSLRLI